MFELQGHRGARGLKPENTLLAFEAAFDAGVASVETDVHLSADDVPVLIHDAVLHAGLVQVRPDVQAPPPAGQLVRSLTLAQLGNYRVGQDIQMTPLASLWARAIGIDPLAIPALSDLFAFTRAYEGEMGRAAGKTPDQQEAARRVRFDLELKRLPYYPETIGDGFTGKAAALLERQVVSAVATAGMLERTRIRSFDHRSVQAVGRLAPGLETALLVAGTAPIDPGQLTRQAGASVYCPDFHFLDAHAVRLAHAAQVRVLPWTVNDPADWQRLISWGVDGLTTDYPDRLSRFLQEHRGKKGR